jgi:LPXTG-motif cell wall-anchored protein
LKSIKAIACAFASALAVLVFTFALLGPHASAQTNTDDYTPSSVGAGNLSQGGGNTANTGSSSTIPLATLGIGLVSVGGVAIALARRRRTVASATA